MEGVAARAIRDAVSCRQSRIFDYSFLLEDSIEVPIVGIILPQLGFENEKRCARSWKRLQEYVITISKGCAT